MPATESAPDPLEQPRKAPTPPPTPPAPPPTPPAPPPAAARNEPVRLSGREQLAAIEARRDRVHEAALEAARDRCTHDYPSEPGTGRCYGCHRVPVRFAPPVPASANGHSLNGKAPA